MIVKMWLHINLTLLIDGKEEKVFVELCVKLKGLNMFYTNTNFSASN